MPEVGGGPAKQKKCKEKHKDKEHKKDKVKDKEGKVKDKDKKKEKKDKKKRERSKSQDGLAVTDGPRQRKSKWDADSGQPSAIATLACPSPENSVFDLTADPKLMPAQMPEHYASEDKDTMLQFDDEQMLERTVIIDPLPLDVKSSELVEFLNGAVLAVTGNTLLQANRPEAPIFSCTVTEEDRGIDGKCKVADLRFRTPDGANVGMRLGGLEYKGISIRIRRPENFVMPEDAADPSAEIELQNVQMVKLIGPKNYCCIFNLPDLLTEAIARDLLGQFGRLKFMKLTMDSATNKIKGYGLFMYVDIADADFAIRALNGFVCGNNVICVRWMGEPSALPAHIPAAPTCTEINGSITQKIIANPAVAMLVKQGRILGEQPSTVVQVLNAVQRADLVDDQEYDDIVKEVRKEASAYGKVNQVIIPRPLKDGGHIVGVGKIFVLFVDLTAARKFQSDTNGRKFDKRTACAAFYPADKFLEGRYRLSGGELSSEKPKPPPEQETIEIE